MKSCILNRGSEDVQNIRCEASVQKGHRHDHGRRRSRNLRITQCVVQKLIKATVTGRAWEAWENPYVQFRLVWSLKWAAGSRKNGCKSFYQLSTLLKNQTEGISHFHRAKVAEERIVELITERNSLTLVPNGYMVWNEVFEETLSEHDVIVSIKTESVMRWKPIRNC